jgi:hypothetical protein
MDRAEIAWRERGCRKLLAKLMRDGKVADEVVKKIFVTVGPPHGRISYPGFQVGKVIVASECAFFSGLADLKKEWGGKVEPRD